MPRISPPITFFSPVGSPIPSGPLTPHLHPLSCLDSRFQFLCAETPFDDSRCWPPWGAKHPFDSPPFPRSCVSVRNICTFYNISHCIAVTHQYFLADFGLIPPSHCSPPSPLHLPPKGFAPNPSSTFLTVGLFSIFRFSLRAHLPSSSLPFSPASRYQIKPVVINEGKPPRPVSFFFTRVPPPTPL